MLVIERTVASLRVAPFLRGPVSKSSRYACVVVAALATLGCHGATRLERSSPALLLGDVPAPFLALSVANIDRMTTWYRDTLGFEVFASGLAPNGTTRYALLRQGNAMVELLQIADAKPRTAAAPGTTGAFQIHGFFKSGFVVRDIDAAHRRIQAMQLKLAYELGKPPNGPFRSFGIRDPEGNLLQFFGL